MGGRYTNKQLTELTQTAGYKHPNAFFKIGCELIPLLKRQF